jgi:chromosome segregation ATPase
MDITYDLFGKWFDTKFPPKIDEIKTSRNWLTESFTALSESVTGLGASLSGIKADFTVLSAGVTAVKADEKGLSILGQQVMKWPWADALERRFSGFATRINKQEALTGRLEKWNEDNLPRLDSLANRSANQNTEIERLQKEVDTRKSANAASGTKISSLEDQKEEAKANKNFQEARRLREEANKERQKIAQATAEAERYELDIKHYQGLVESNQREIKKMVDEGNDLYRRAIRVKNDVAKAKKDAEKTLTDLDEAFTKKVNDASRALSGNP